MPNSTYTHHGGGVCQKKEKNSSNNTFFLRSSVASWLHYDELFKMFYTREKLILFSWSRATIKKQPDVIEACLVARQSGEFGIVGRSAWTSFYRQFYRAHQKHTRFSDLCSFRLSLARLFLVYPVFLWSWLHDQRTTALKVAKITKKSGVFHFILRSINFLLGCWSPKSRL